MYIDKRISEFFKTQNLYKKEFFDFIKERMLIVPSGTDISWYGCFPIVEDDILKDIRLLVPEIETEKDLLINIHEFTHAIELYDELEMPYEEKREQREYKAKSMEKIYLKKFKK